MGFESEPIRRWRIPRPEPVVLPERETAPEREPEKVPATPVPEKEPVPAGR